MAEERKVQLGFAVDATGARQGFQEVKDASREMAQGVQQSAQQAGKAIDGMGSGGGQAAQKVDGAARSIIGSIQRTTATMQAGEKGTASYYEALAGQRGVNSDILRPYLDQLRQVEAAQKGATVALAGGSASMDKLGASAGQTKAALRQLPAQFTDIITSLQGGQKPLTVLIQQGGQIKDAFGGIGETFRALGGQAALLFPTLAAAMGGVVAQQQAMAEGAGAAAEGMGDVAAGANDAAEAAKNAGVALNGARVAAAGASSGLLIAGGVALAVAVAMTAVVIAYRKGAEESFSFEAALLKTGNIIGTTTGQLREMAQAIGEAGDFTEGAAAEALVALASSGKIAGDSLKNLTEIALDMEEYVGQSVGDTAKVFAELGNEPTKAVLKLNESLHFLTLAQLEQIKSLEEHGDKTKAAQLAQEAYADAVKPTINAYKANLDSLDVILNFWTDKGKKMWDALVGNGRQDTSQDRIAKLRTQLAALDGPNPFKNASLSDAVSGAFDAEGTKNRLRAGMQEQLVYLERVTQAAKDSAKSESERQRTQEAGIAVSDAVAKAQEKGLSKQAQMNKALEDYRENIEKIRAANPESALLDAKKIAAGEKAIREQFKEKASSGAAPAGESELATMRAKTAAARDYLKALQANGLAADKQNEFEAQASRLQKELEGSIKGVARANKEKTLAEALAGAETQKAIDAKKLLLKVQADFENARDKESMASAADIQKINDKAQALEDEAAAYGKTAVELQALTIARLEDKAAMLTSFDATASEAEIAAIREKIKALTSQGEAAAYLAGLKLGSTTDETLRNAQEMARLYQSEASTAGLTATQRKLISEQRKIALEYAKKEAAIDTSGADEATKAANRVKLAQAQQTEMGVAAAQAQDEAWSGMWASVDQTAHDVFVNVADEGMDAFKRIGKTLKASILDMLYQMTIKKWIFQIAGNMGGGVGGMVGAMAGGGGGSGALNMASNAYSLYSSIGTASSGLSAFGNSLYATTQSMMGMTGTTAQMVQSLQSAGYWTGSATSTQATTMGAQLGGGGSSGGGAASGSGYATAAVAAVMLVANAMGFFSSDKIVGNGIYGKLGSNEDLNTYNLRREGGTLFRGPNYSTEDPGEAIRGVEESITQLKKSIADGTYGYNKGDYNPSGLMDLDTQENLLRDLKNKYGDQIDAAKNQSDSIQKTYDTLRTGVGDMADSLGLGSAAVREYTTTLGKEKVHPDVGTIGLNFEGLSQEDIGKKITEALRTASNEMAEQLIGSWSTVTDTITQNVQTQWGNGDGGGQDEYTKVQHTTSKVVYTASEYAKTGETAIETLTRLATSLTNVNGVFDMLGATMLDASLAGGDAASKILDAFGGAEAFNAATGAFYESYYSEAERMAKSTELLGKEFAKAGVEMPATKDAYRALVKEQLDAGEGGAELAAKLMKLGPAFAQATDYAEQAKEQAAEAVRTMLSDAGISGETIADKLRDAMLGRISASDAGGAIADMVTGGIYNAIAGGLAQQLTDLLMTSLIAPVVQAAVAGSAISEAVSQSAIDNMVAQARAAADALGTIFSDPAFRAAIAQVGAAIASVASAAGGAAFRPYTPAVVAQQATPSSGSDYSAPVAEVKSAWIELLADIVRQTQDARQELAELGMTSYQSALAGIQRRGQDALDKLIEGGYGSERRKELDVLTTKKKNNDWWIEYLPRRIDALSQAENITPGYIDQLRSWLQTAFADSNTLGQSIATLTEELAAIPPEIQALIDAETALLDARNKSTADKTVAGLMKEIAQMDMTPLQKQLADIAERADEYVAGLQDLGQGTDANIAAVEAWEAAMIAAAQNGGSAAESLTQVTDDAFAALERAAGVQRDLLTETISDLQAVFDMTRDAARDLYGEVESAIQQSAAAGQAFIDNALANAQATGYMPDADKLREAIDGVRKGIAAQQGTSTFEAERDRLVLAGKLTDLKDIAEPQLTEAQRQLAALEEMLSAARTQIDELRGINTSVLSVVGAMTALAAAIAAEKATVTPVTPVVPTPVVTGGGGGGGGASVGGSVIDQAYQLVLGRSPDAPGAAYWGSVLGPGTTLVEAINAIVNGAVASGEQINLPGFAVGINRVPYDMTARIHEGEAVVPARFNPFNPSAQFGGGNNAEMVAELRALRAEVAALRTASERTASNTAQMPQMAEQFDNVTEGGSVLRTEVMA